MRYQILRRVMIGLLGLGVVGAALMVNGLLGQEAQPLAFVYMPDLADRESKVVENKSVAPVARPNRTTTAAPCKPEPQTRKSATRDPFKQLLRGIMI